MANPPPSPDNEAYAGAQDLSSSTSHLNALDYLVRVISGGDAHVALVLVMAVTNEGGVQAAGTVDVNPLVAQIDGKGNATQHGTIYGVPYSRVQGGTDAVILDPKVGDIGVCVFADRDISAVKNTKAAANPGSFRRFDWADGLYIGGVLNGVPTQYVRFSTDGVEVVSPTQIKLTAPDIQFDGPTHTTGAVTGDQSATYLGEVIGNDVELSTHLTSGVTPGGGTSGPPIP